MGHSTWKGWDTQEEGEGENKRRKRKERRDGGEMQGTGRNQRLKTEERRGEGGSGRKGSGGGERAFLGISQKLTASE